MKKMKSKIATALVLGAISFGMFSFTTTPINAQVTSSIVTSEFDDEQEVARLSLRAARNLGRLAYYAAAGIVEGAAYLLFGAEEASVYPNTALD